MTLGPQRFTLSSLFEAAKAGQWSAILNLLYSGWLSIKSLYLGSSFLDIAENQQNGTVIQQLQRFYQYIDAAEEMENDNNVTPRSSTFTSRYHSTLQVPTPFRPLEDQQKYCQFIVNGFPRLQESFSPNMQP